MIRPLRPNAVTAYLDLRQALLDDEAAEVVGTVEVRERAGRLYAYERYRLGSEAKARYLGEATPQLLDRVRRAPELRERAAERRAHRARVVQVLRAEGMLPVGVETGQLLAAFARVGVFRLGGTLVGTNAYRLFEGELGVRLADDRLVQTGDLDVASFHKLSVALDDVVSEPLQGALAELDFEPVPGLPNRDVWRWRQTRRDTAVEFLTAAFQEEAVLPLPALGVSAQALRYLNFLLREPIKAVALYRSGVLVQVPRPERYAIHKLIVADRRRGGADAPKAAKDREQAATLIDVLAETRPDELLLAWEDARARGPRWRERLDRTLARMPAAAARLQAL